MYMLAVLMKPYCLLPCLLAVDPYTFVFVHFIRLCNFIGQFKVQVVHKTQQSIYIAIRSGNLKRIVGFTMHTQATCHNPRCAQRTRGLLWLVKTICALLDSLNFLSI